MTLLMSVIVPLATHVIRILAVVVDGPVTIQLKVPLAFAVFGADAAIVSV